MRKSLSFTLSTLCTPLVLVGCGQGGLSSFTSASKEYFHNYVNSLAPNTYAFSAANNPEDKIVSSAYLYKGVTNSDVDVRTGQFNVSFPIAHLAANSLGTDFILNLNYSSGMPYDRNNPYSVAKNWSYSLPYIDVDNRVVHTSSGQVLHYTSDEAKGKQKFDYYKLNDIVFNISDIDEDSKKFTKGTITYSDDHTEEFAISDAIPYGVLQKISYANGYWVSFIYQGLQLVKITDAYNNSVDFTDNEIYSKIADKDYSVILGKGGFGSFVTLNSIAFNNPNKKINFNYASESDNVYAGLLKAIDTPTGSSTRLTYGLMAALSPQGSTVSLPVVVKKEIFPSADDSDQVAQGPATTQYTYGTNQVNGVFQGSNYTGYPNFNYANNHYSETPNDFIYSTTVSVTQESGEKQNTTYYFNHLNLLLKEVSYIGNNLAEPESSENRLVAQKNISYCDSILPNVDVKINEKNHLENNCDVYVKDLGSNYSQARYVSETLYSSKDRSRNVTSLSSYSYNPYGLVTEVNNDLNNTKEKTFYISNLNGMNVVPYIKQKIFSRDGTLTEVKEFQKFTANIPGTNGQKTNFLANVKKTTYFNPKNTVQGLVVKGGAKTNILDLQGVVIDTAYPVFQTEQEWGGCDANGYAFLCSEKLSYPNGSPVSSFSSLRVSSTLSKSMNINVTENHSSEFYYEFTNNNKVFSITAKKMGSATQSGVSLSKKTDFDSASGLVLRESYPNGNKKIINYDNYGRTLNVSMSDVNSNTLESQSYEYDNNNYAWVLSTNDKTGLQTKYWVDSLGRDYKVENNKGTNNLVERRRLYYNSLGQVVKAVSPFGQNSLISMDYSYDELGRVLQEKSSTGVASNYIYNDLWFDSSSQPVQLIAKYTTSENAEDRSHLPPFSITKKDLRTQKVIGTYTVKNNVQAKDYKSLESLLNSDSVIYKKEMFYNDLNALIKETSLTPESKNSQFGDLISYHYLYDLKGDLIQKEFPAVQNLVISGVPQTQSIALNMFSKHDIDANPVCLGIGTNQNDNVCE